MATETTLRFIKLDYQAHKNALLQRVRARYPRAWNDFLANSFGIVLIDIVAFGLATMAFLINRVAGENFIGTMTLRESAIRVGQLVGYKLHNPIPSAVYCEATLTSALSSDVSIAKGTQIRASDQNGTVFEVVADYTIVAGDLTPKTQVALFSVTSVGQYVVSTLLQFTQGSENVDAVDTTIDLSQILQVGQSLNKLGEDQAYVIKSLDSVPGSVAAYTRIVLESAYAGTTATDQAEVYDRRIALVQGQTVEDRFTAPSSGGQTAGYSVQLSRTPVIDDSVVVEVNGELWREVPDTSYRSPEDLVYVVRTFVSGKTVIVFGNDRFGKSVPVDATIDVTYRIGGGVGGNIALNQINTSVVGLTSDTSSPISISIANETATGVGGQDAETLEEARTAIPYYAKTNDRCVTLSDYQVFAQAFSSLQFGSVAYAKASTRRQNALLEGNTVYIYAWTTGPSGSLVNLPAQLKQALQTYLQDRAVGTDYVVVSDGSARPVPVSLRFRTESGFDLTTTWSLVDDALKDFMAKLRPGATVVFSDLVRAIDAVTGVSSVDFATPNSDIVPDNDTELFTVPDDLHVYDLEKVSAGTAADGELSVYTAQLPVYPVTAWSIRLFLGTTELTILPFYRPSYAKLIGASLSTDETDYDEDGLPDYASTVNLLTGQVTLYVSGVAGDFTMKLTSVQGYTQDRTVAVYIGYAGENTLTKRREIRSTVRSWSAQLGIGQALYGRRMTGISSSASSITDVVESISGVDAVTRVALDTPNNTADRLLASTYEVLKLGNIVINNQVD